MPDKASEANEDQENLFEAYKVASKAALVPTWGQSGELLTVVVHWFFHKSIIATLPLNPFLTLTARLNLT